MSAAKYKPGDIVYSGDGQEAEFVAHTGGEFIVRPIYEDEDGPQAGGIRTWSNVFRTPPAPKLDAETAAAEQRLADARAQLREVEDFIRSFEREEKARMDRIKQHEMLTDLDRYISGEMTHYVATHDYYPSVEIIPLGETLSDYASSSEYGLLTLHPSRSWDKKVRWSVYYRSKDRYRYSETKTVIPCCGEQAAQEKAREVVHAYLKKYADMEPNRRSYAEQLVASCQKFGVEVPQWLIDGIAQNKRAELERSIEDHRTKLAEAEQALAAIGTQGGTA